MSRDDGLRLMATAADASSQVRKLWGEASLGLALVTKFYSDDPWATAAEIAAATGLSEDTVRRKLAALQRIGRVRRGQRGRVAVYKAHRDWSARTYDIVKSMVLAAKCG